ncbi:hypothetical protein [Carnobacterium sp. AT7]
MFACLAIFLLLIDTYSPTKKMPKIIGYIYYPLHQLILLVIRFNL